MLHHIRRFVAQMHGQGLSGRSLARLLSAWRGFFLWLGERGLVKANPCDGIRPPKIAASVAQGPVGGRNGASAGVGRG